MNQKITTSQPVSTALVIRLLKALDKAGADDCGEWLLVHPNDLDQLLTDTITDLAWAFRSTFLSGVTGIEQDVFEAIQANERFESNNPAMLSIIRGTCGIETFVRQAIQADGAGHFLAGYDNEEFECPVKIGKNWILWTAYRTN